MLILSHRGYHEQYPDNTLDAFADAAAMGVDGIETDVRLSADGQAVLFHDRSTKDGRLVEELTLAQLSELAGYEVPTLQAALDRWPDLLWNMEIKSPQAADATLAILRTHAASHCLLVTSAWHQLIERLGNLYPFDFGIIVNHCPLDVPLSGAGRRPEASPIRSVVWAYEFLDAELLKRTAELGIRNFAWGAETPADYEHCLELGLAGVIVDRPEWLLEVRSRGRGTGDEGGRIGNFGTTRK